MSAITVILIAAFAIDRLVAGFFFLLSFCPDLRPLVVEDKANGNPRAARARRLIYTLAASYLGVVVVAGILKVHIFEMTQIAAPGVPMPNPLLDTLLSGMMMAAGADRLSALVKSFGEPGGKKDRGEKPVEITGKIVLEQSRGAGA